MHTCNNEIFSNQIERENFQEEENKSLTMLYTPLNRWCTHTSNRISTIFEVFSKLNRLEIKFSMKSEILRFLNVRILKLIHIGCKKNFRLFKRFN